jgi:enamine deaminase RidA (YjgF/YER057c/UK114 family)
MPSTILNPPEPIDPTAFGFSHAVSMPVGGALVFIAGQYGCDHTGQTTSPDFATQVERSFANLLIAVHAVGLGAG